MTHGLDPSDAARHPSPAGRAPPFWLPPGRNQPYLQGRVDEDLFTSLAESYADRRHMAAVAARAGLPSAALLDA